MKEIPIEELTTSLKLTDLRAVRNWCKKNEVVVLRHGKNEFVFESNFKEAFEKPFINKLKSKFGSEWESVYLLYKEGNIPALNMLSTNVVLLQSNYQPSNSISKKYLNKYKYGKDKAA